MTTSEYRPTVITGPGEPMSHGLADSGAREVAENGFTREPDAEKPDLSWLFTVRGIELVPQEIIERIAGHFANGAEKYAPDNWRRGTSPEALARYKRSLARHIFQWFRGESDEDHAAAVAWNIFVYEINKAAAEVPVLDGAKVTFDVE